MATYAEETSVAYHKVMEHVNGLLGEHEASSKESDVVVTGQSSSSSSSGYQPSLKVVEALKPATLTADSDPEEMKQWKDGFISYHEMSNMSLTSKAVQQAFLKATLDTDINSYLEN